MNKNNSLNILNYNKINKNIKHFEKEKEPITLGLVPCASYNAGISATLQSLSNTNALTDYFLNKFIYEENNKSKIISNEYYQVIKNLWDINNKKQSYEARKFIRVLEKELKNENLFLYDNYKEDIKSFINYLLERLHNELNANKNNNQIDNYTISQNDHLDEYKMLNLFLKEFCDKYNSIISNLFYNSLETKCRCLECYHIKYNFQGCSLFEFPLKQINSYCFKMGKRKNYNAKSNKNPDIDLYECFEYYESEKLMTGDNQVYCDICSKNCDKIKKTIINTASNILIIYLDRGKNLEYDSEVLFPEQLNLYNFVNYKEGNTLFEIYAIILFAAQKLVHQLGTY